MLLNIILSGVDGQPEPGDDPSKILQKNFGIA
jgi:hypothetical protein